MYEVARLSPFAISRGYEPEEEEKLTRRAESFIEKSKRDLIHMY
jgi:hypothetical protein